MTALRIRLVRVKYLLRILIKKFMELYAHMQDLCTPVQLHVIHFIQYHHQQPSWQSLLDQTTTELVKA